MSVLQTSSEGMDPPLQDPWDWTVNQVVFALTDQDSLLLRSNSTLSLPPPATLASALRENDVNGLALLNEVHTNSLRDDLGLKSMSHRASINYLIRLLKDTSVKYQQQAVSSARASSIGMGSRMGTPFPGSPLQYQGRASSTAPGPWTSPTACSIGQIQISNGNESVAAAGFQPMAVPVRDAHAGAPEVHQPNWQRPNSLGSAQGLEISVDEVKDEYNESREPDSSSSRPHVGDADILLENIPKAANDEAGGKQQRPNETTIIDETGRQRRRLILAPSDVVPQPAPQHDGCIPSEVDSGSSNTLLDQSIDVAPIESTISPLSNHFSTDHDGSLTHNTSNEIHMEDSAVSNDDGTQDLPEPGSLLIDTNGRKRMRPILITAPELGLGTAESACNLDQSPATRFETFEHPTGFKQKMFGRKVSRTRDQIYLGHEPLSVDKLFYGDVPIETELDESQATGLYNDSDHFAIDPNTRSSAGVSIYVNARFKYFFRSPSVVLEPGQRARVGIIPYPDRIGKKHFPLSFTMFTSSPRGVVVTRSNRQKWIGSSPKSNANATSEDKANVFNVVDPASAHDVYDDVEWKALEKWKYLSGQDDVLPVYGESGSENEYELDTWKEIEQERGQLTRPVGESRSRKLAAEDVELAIQTAVQKTIQAWGIQRKPKLQRKARSQWVKSRRHGTVQAQMANLERDIEALDSRILNLHKEIAQEDWSTSSQIIKQCKIIQPSIFDREDYKWKYENLVLRKIPEASSNSTPTEKPDTVKVRIIKPNLEANEDDENLMTGAESLESSDCSMGSFIVEDETDNERQSPIDSDLMMADVEADADSETLIADQEDISSANKPSYQSFDVSSPQTKDLDRQQNSPPSKPPIIDLTLDSDSVQMPTPDRKTSYTIKTPPIHDSENESDVFQRSRGRKAVFKVPPIFNPKNVISLESESADSTDTEKSLVAKEELPALNDVASIREMDPSVLVERQDRKRLLMWKIAHANASRRQAASAYLTQASLEKCRSDTTVALKKLRGYGRKLSGVDNEKSDLLMSIASWYVCWTIPVKIDQSGVKVSHINATLADEDGFEPFHDCLLLCLSHCHIALDAIDQATPSKKRQKILLGSDEGPSRKRKYAVTESQETLEKRQAAQERLRGNEARRLLELQSRRLTMGRDAKEGSDIILNPGKLEDEEYVYLNSSFGNGANMKEHQEKGLQFMWRELTTDHKDMQGCLLAHNQGLGKTMQVIALLVAIAETAKSSSKKVRRQVPRLLRKSQTLILCPVTLVENWWDELLLWAPSPLSESIGKIRKVNSSMIPSLRIGEIRDWSEEGGVLVLGYDTFKNLVHNQSLRLGAEEHELMLDALLERPNLVVADEAQNFKNRTSSLHKAIHQIKTGSRVALTGTPLSNDLGEYFSLVDWVSPNYLGSRADFRAIYEEPIYDGLYNESTQSQYRESRKRLFALEIELGPKVHRAGVEVLHGELCGKMEFVIKVPLTKLQEDIYRVYVVATLMASKNDEPRLATLWSWLSVLQLLCNHPKSYKDKLVELKERTANPPLIQKSNSKKKSRKIIGEEGALGSEEDNALLEEPNFRSAISQAIPESEVILNVLSEPIETLSLSNKMQILMSILEFAEAAQDKVLVFSHRIGSLDYVESRLVMAGKPFARIDGSSVPQKRQQTTKDFNDGLANVCLISTRAGGTGLNLFGANRVVILDEHFNPTWERQAIGRAYRIGQKKPVYVYRLTVDGTFEQGLQNQALFKEQLATRAVDGKHPNRSASKGAGQYFFLPRPSIQHDLSQFLGKDTLILDRLLADQTTNRILSIIPTESFHVEDGLELTVDEKKDAELMQKARKDQSLRRRDPAAYDTALKVRIQSVQDHTRVPPPLDYGSANHAPPNMSPVPWNRLQSVSGNLAYPSPIEPSFMGGLPHPDIGTSGVFAYPNTGQPSFVPGPSWTVEDKNSPAATGTPLQYNFSRINPSYRGESAALSGALEEMNSSTAIRRQLHLEPASKDALNDTPASDSSGIQEKPRSSPSTPSKFYKDHEESLQENPVTSMDEQNPIQIDCSPNGSEPRNMENNNAVPVAGMLSGLEKSETTPTAPEEVQDLPHPVPISTLKERVHDDSPTPQAANFGLDGSQEVKRQKRGRSKQRPSGVKRMKPSWDVLPNYASTGPTAEQFDTFLEKEAFRSLRQWRQR